MLIIPRETLGNTIQKSPLKQDLFDLGKHSFDGLFEGAVVLLHMLIEVIISSRIISFFKLLDPSQIVPVFSMLYTVLPFIIFTQIIGAKRSYFMEIKLKHGQAEDTIHLSYEGWE